MALILNIILGICGAAMIVCIITLIRNNMIFNIRMKANKLWSEKAQLYNRLLHEEVSRRRTAGYNLSEVTETYKVLLTLQGQFLQSHNNLPTYEQMLWQWTKWTDADFLTDYRIQLAKNEEDILLVLSHDEQDEVLTQE